MTPELAAKLGLLQEDLPEPIVADDTVERLLSLIAPELLAAEDLDGFTIALS